MNGQNISILFRISLVFIIYFLTRCAINLMFLRIRQLHKIVIDLSINLTLVAL
jgi:hypothetical protein